MARRAAGICSNLCAWERYPDLALCTRARGVERLSVSHQGEPANGAAQHDQRAAAAGEKKQKRQQRSTDIGRALRTIYDDTVRESVPDDFRDLLGKLD